MNFKRFVTAFFLFPLLVFIILKAEPLLISVLILLTAFICFYEWAGLFELPLSWLFFGELLLSSGLSLCIAFNIPVFYVFYLFLLSSFLPFLLIYEKQKFSYIFFPFLIGLFYLFIGLLPFWKILLRFKREYLIFFFSVVFANDTGAYLTGKTLGRYPFFSRISPKKTWEGFFGGILLSLVVGEVLNRFWHLFPQNLNILIVILLAVTGTIGDLFESAFKRMVNKKDSGKIIWGHGGMLDRIDGVLFASPIFLIILEFFKK